MEMVGSTHHIIFCIFLAFSFLGILRYHIILWNFSEFSFLCILCTTPPLLLWKNGKDIDPDDLTIKELEFFQKELSYFSEEFKSHIKYLEKL